MLSQLTLYFPGANSLPRSVGRGGRGCCAQSAGYSCLDVEIPACPQDLQAPWSKSTESFLSLELRECMWSLHKFKWTWKLFRYAFLLLICTFICTSGLENLKPRDQLCLGWLVWHCNKAKYKHGRRGSERQLPFLLAALWTVLPYGDMLIFSHVVNVQSGTSLKWEMKC